MLLELPEGRVVELTDELKDYRARASDKLFSYPNLRKGKYRVEGPVQTATYFERRFFGRDLMGIGNHYDLVRVEEE